MFGDLGSSKKISRWCRQNATHVHRRGGWREEDQHGVSQHRWLTRCQWSGSFTLRNHQKRNVSNKKNLTENQLHKTDLTLNINEALQKYFEIVYQIIDFELGSASFMRCILSASKTKRTGSRLVGGCCCVILDSQTLSQRKSGRNGSRTCTNYRISTNLLRMKTS